MSESLEGRNVEQLKMELKTKVQKMDLQQLYTLTEIVDNLLKNPDFLLTLQQLLATQKTAHGPVSEPTVMSTDRDANLEIVLSTKHVAYSPEKMKEDLNELLKSELEPLLRELKEATDSLRTINREDIVQALHLGNEETYNIPAGIEKLIQELPQLKQESKLWEVGLREGFYGRWLHYSFRAEAICRDYLANVTEVKQIYQALIKINRAILRALHRLNIQVLGVAGDETAPTIKMLTTLPAQFEKMTVNYQPPIALKNIPEIFDAVSLHASDRPYPVVDIKTFRFISEEGGGAAEIVLLSPAEWDQSWWLAHKKAKKK